MELTKGKNEEQLSAFYRELYAGTQSEEEMLRLEEAAELAEFAKMVNNTEDGD